MHGISGLSPVELLKYYHFISKLKSFPHYKKIFVIKYLEYINPNSERKRDLIKAQLELLREYLYSYVKFFSTLDKPKFTCCEKCGQMLSGIWDRHKEYISEEFSSVSLIIDEILPPHDISPLDTQE